MDVVKRYVFDCERVSRFSRREICICDASELHEKWRHPVRVYITTLSPHPCHVVITVPDLNFEDGDVIEPSLTQGIGISLPRYVFPNRGDELTPSVIVNSTCPVSVNVYFQYGAWAESFTVLPTNALDNEYLIIGNSHVFGSEQFPVFFSISALSEVTSVHVELSIGGELDYVLQPYESFFYENSVKGTDLTGSFVSANSSIAVISGMTCAYVPAVGSGPCATIIEQMLPIPPASRAPFEFVLAPFLNRTSGYAYRLIGASDNVTVVINQGETRRLSKYETYEGTSDEVIYITSDGPIYVSQYMKSFATDRIGGAAMVTIPPVSSYANNVTFYAFDGGNPNTIIHCYINIIVKCEHINELLLDETTSLATWNRLSLEERNVCVVRGRVEIGSHSIVTHNEDVTFLVIIYGIPVQDTFAFLHLGRFYIDEEDATTTVTMTTPIITTIASASYTTMTTDLQTTRVPDNEPPTLVCPIIMEQHVTTDESVKNVTWSEPIYTDNSGIEVARKSSHHPPTQFPVGNHRVVYKAWDPHGNTATCVVIVQITAACPAVSIQVGSQNLSWPQTAVRNQTVPSNERCEVDTENRGKGLAYRLCVPDEQRIALWLPVIITSCGRDDEIDLQKLSETDVVESNAKSVAEALHSVTDDVDELTIQDVEDVADTIRHIADVETVTSEVITDVVAIVNNVVTTTNKHATTTPDELATKGPHLSNILIAFEEQITRIANTGQTFDPVIESNIALSSATKSSQGNATARLNFAVLSDNYKDNSDNTFTEENIKVYESNSEIVGMEIRSSISLPASVFNVSRNDTIGVNFVAYNTATLFPSYQSNKTVSSDILSAIVGGNLNVNKLQDPVVLEFTITGENPVCVFWDFDNEDWSQTGCQLVNSTSLRTVCHCNHLTNFAVLVDPTYKESHFILDIISKVGCGLSICALLITILIFICFRRLRTGVNATPRIIHVHLCISLLLLYTVFLVGIDLVSHRTLCMSIAAILQWLTLASLSWMTVEAYNLYLNVVRMFDVEPEHFVKKAFVVAWGVPLIVTGLCVGLSVGLSWPYYDHLDYCFVAIGPVFYYGLVVPVGLLLLYNMITFVWVMTHLCKANLGGNVTQQSKIHVISKRFWHALTISVLMGLTWVSGFLAIEGAKLVFSIIFCVCNSLQGVVIFLLFCVRQEDVRKTVFPFCNPKSQGTSSSRHETHSTALSRSQTRFTTNLNRKMDDFDTIIPTTEYHIGHGRGGSYTNFAAGVPEYELSHIDNDYHHPDDHDHNLEPQADPASPLLVEHTKTSSQKSSASSSSKKC
ncbi:uncharacterized protein [Amphiura filiformis]|uniref:uncharacterized protein n=1 Tax=Amphiura filiformis TaxID=82378 RepID=UPI003B226822